MCALESEEKTGHNFCPIVIIFGQNDQLMCLKYQLNWSEMKRSDFFASVSLRMTKKNCHFEEAEEEDVST